MSDEDFCLIHGRDYMTREQIPECTKCKAEKAEAEPVCTHPLLLAGSICSSCGTFVLKF